MLKSKKKNTKPLHAIKVTFEVKHNFMKNLRLHNLSIDIFFFLNWFINECSRKNLDKIPMFHRSTVFL